MRTGNKKFFPYIAFLLVVSTGWILYARLNSAPASSSLSQRPEGLTSLFSMKRALNQPRIEPGEQIKNSQSQTPACLAFWNEIQKLDLDQLSFPPKLFRLPEAGSCSSASESLSRLQSEYVKNCAALLSDGLRTPETEAEWHEEAGPCIAALYFLRAGISSWQARDQKLSEITDLRLLTDLLASAFGKAMGPKPEPGEMIAVAQRILEIDPKIFGAHKALLIGEFLDGVGGKGGQKDDAFWVGMEDSIKRASELNPTDPDLKEIEKIARTHGYDSAWSKTEAQKLLAENPNSSDAFQLLGFAEWRQGHREAAFDALQNAMKLNPNNEELKRIWSAIHAPDAKDKSYPLDVKVGLQFDDILK